MAYQRLFTRMRKAAQNDDELWDADAEQRVRESTERINRENLEKYGTENPTTEDITGVPLHPELQPMTTPEQSYEYSKNQLDKLTDEQKADLESYTENKGVGLSASKSNALQKNEFGFLLNVLPFFKKSQKAKQELKQSDLPDTPTNIDKVLQYEEYQKYVNDYENRQRQKEELSELNGAELESVRDLGAVVSPISNLSAAVGAMEKPYDERLGRNINGENSALVNINKDIDEIQHKNIENLAGDGTLGDALKFLYDTKNQVIESSASMMAGANTLDALGIEGATKAGKLIADKAGNMLVSLPGGAAAYQNQIEDGMRRGLTEEEAQKEALVAAAIEVGTETLGGSFGLNVFRNVGKKLAGNTAKELTKEVGESIAKKMLGEVASEASEELVGNIAYSIADNIITGDKSVYNQAVKDYQAQGMSEEDAEKEAKLDWIKDTAKEMAMAGVAAGVSMGGAAAVSTVAERSEAKKLDGNYKNVADAIPNNVEDYQDEEAYNKAMEVKEKALQLDEAPKVTGGERVNLLKDIYAVNETMPNVDLIDSINESVNSPFANVGGFQVAKNDITSQEVAQSMSQASQDNNINDFVEAYRDSQASSNAEARQIGQEYFETLAPKFDTYDEGSRPLDLALTQRSAEDLYTAALNGEEVNQEELNTTKKQQLFQRGMLENTVKQEVEAQRQARREEQKTFEPTQLHNIETPQGKADIADITLDNEGNFKWTKGDEEVVVPRKDISDNAMQRFMVNALNQPTLSAKQLYIDNYDGSIPIGSYNNAYESAFNAGQLNSKNFKGWLGSHKFYARSIPQSTLEAFFNEGAKQVENKSKKVTKAKTKGTGKVTAEKSVENTPIHKLAQAFASKTGIDVEIRDGSILVTDGAQNALTDAEGNEIYSNGQFQADISKVIVGANGKELQTFMHEAIGEVLEAYNPEDMADIQDAILNYLLESKGDNYVDKTIKRYQRLYTAAEGTKSYRDAANEMVNDTLVGLFTTDKGANDFVNWCTKNDKSVLEKITDFIQAIIDKLKSLISDANLSSEARTVAEMSEKQAQKIRDRLFKAMDKAIDNYKGAEKGKAENKTRYSFAGIMANDFSLETRDRAEQLEREYNTPQDIFRETGMFRGADGHWRFEIGDEDVQLKVNNKIHDELKKKERVYLKDIIDHEALFRNYPSLENVKIVFKDFADGTEGSYSPTNREIAISNDVSPDSVEFVDVIMHEIQHAIQHMEGFASGASPEYWQKRRLEMVEKEEKALDKMINIREGLTKEEQNAIGEILFERYTNRDFNKASELREDAIKKYGEPVQEYFNAEDDYYSVRFREDDNAYDMYYKTAGEIEARNVVNRMQLFDEEERRNVNPVIADENGQVYISEKRNPSKTVYDFRAKDKTSYSLDVDSIETNNNNIFQFDNENLNKEEQTGVFKKVKAVKGLPYIWIIAPKYVSNDTWKALAEIEGTDWKNLKDRAVRSNKYYVDNSYTQDFLEYLTGSEVEDNTKLADEKAEEAEETFGTTSSWEDTGYLTTNGSQIDLSVKDSGASYREDHNSISEIMDSNGVDAVYDFLKLGNIRIIPEVSGIELIEEPNSEQYDKLYDYFAYNNGEARVDLSNDKGGGEGTILYREGTSPQRIISDIENYFETGEVPEGTDDGNVYYSLDTEGNELTEGQQEYFKDSKVRDENGNLLVLYHQTDSDFTVFDTRRQGAGTSDRQTPFGIFLKSSDANIGLAGNKQMKLYANITNPLIVRDRSELGRELAKLIPGYSEISNEYKKIDRYYSAREKEADNFLTQYMVDWKGKHPNSKRIELYQDEEYNRLFDNQNNIIDEWGEETDALAIKSKDIITKGLKDLGYDGVILREDAGSFGRRTDAYIALEPNQVKNVDNENPTESEDIRYSLAVDTEGNELSEQQQEYFKDSKVRDDQGRLKVMYHGTIKGGFTKFVKEERKGFFFADDIEVTKAVYAKIGFVGNEDGNTPSVYSVYLNSVNPYIVDANGGYWNNLTLNGESVSTDDICEYAYDNGYDSVIFNDLIDGGNEPMQVVVVFNSNQIKNIDNTNPTESEDIRYSLDVPTTYALDDYDPFIDDDVTETKDSKEAFTNSIIKAANDVLNFNISDKQVSDIADKMIADYSSTVDKEFVTKNLRNIFSAMNSDNIQDMTNALINLSEEVVRQSEEIDPDEQANYDDFIKSMPKIKLSEEQKNEAINRMGDWNTVFGAMGRFLSNNTTTTLDGNVYWQICDNALEHNYVMDRDATDADQLMNIIEAVENMRPQSRAIFEGGDITDAALVTANEIMQQYYGYALKDKNANANLKEVKADLKKQVDDYKRIIGKQYQEQVNRLNKQLKDKDNELKQLRTFNTSEISKAISIEKARIATAEKNARADKTNLNKYIERQERNKYLKSIRNQAIRTIKMLENPTRNKFIPEVLQKPTIEMLQTFDFVTYRVRKNGELVPWGEEKGGEPTKTNRMWREKMEKLQGVLTKLEHITDDKEDLSKYGANSSYLYNLGAQLGDVTEGLLDQFLQETKNDTVKISTLSSDKLKVLDKFMKSYLASINNAQEAMIDGNNVQLAKVGENVVSELQELKPITALDGTTKKKIKDLLNLDMLEPITLLSEMGGTMEKLYWHLEQGKDVRDGHIFDTEEAFIKAKEELNIDKNEPSKWETGLMSFKDGQLQLTPAQVMSLYAAYGRSQARHHIIFGGVKASDKGLRGKDKRLKKIQTKPVHLTPKDVEEIVNTLTPQQKALADFMVDYMSNEVSKWGNRVSQKRWGIRLFTEPHYFPIKTYDATRKTINVEGGNSNSLFALQNQGFTKPLVEDANNALVLENIFSVFAEHVAKMAAYDGYVIPINDFMRVFNYAESQETFVVKQGEEGMHRDDTSVKEQIERVFGTNGTQYITKFIKNVNEDFGEGGSFNFLMDKYKAQAVLANMNVVVQQPTAYPRAAEVIDRKYLAQAVSVAGIHVKRKIRRCQSHNTLAKYKSKGYYETSIGQSMQQMITGTATTKEKINELAGALAGLMDDWTWSNIYYAAELKVQAEQKNLEKDSKEYFDAVNKVANEAFVKTQVVDSVFTKSQIMRSKDTANRILTAFMAEPTKYYNMLHRGWFKTKQTGKKKYIAKAVELYIVGQVLNAVVVSFMGAWRDDDEEKSFWDKFLNSLLAIDDIKNAKGVVETTKALLNANLVSGLLPFNMIPFVKEGINALSGYESKNMTTQAIYDIIGDAQKLVNAAEGKGNLQPYGYLYYAAHAFSLATGIPMASAIREIKDVYNNVNDLWGGDNIVKTETQTDRNKKYFAKSDSITEGAKKVYDDKLEENLEKGKTQEEADKQAKSDAKGAITTYYKDKLVDLKESNMSEAVSLRAELVRAYTSLGDTSKQANSKIDKWFK